MTQVSKELTYVYGREIDKELSQFLKTDDEYTRVALLFMPPRTGKTTSVREAAARQRFDLRYFTNGELRRLVGHMVLDPQVGSFNEFRKLAVKNLNPKDFGLVEGRRVLIHFDEAQEFDVGIDTFRDNVFDFSKPPEAAQLSALVYCARSFCSKDVRVIVSGTALDVGKMIQVTSADKCCKLAIGPTEPKFIKKVLRQQEPPVHVSNSQAAELSGHIGQLYHVYKERRTEDNSVNMEAAFLEWMYETSDRLRWTIGTVLNASLLAAQLPQPSSDNFIHVPHAIRQTSLFRRLMMDGAWMTVMFFRDKPVIVPLSPWQKKALDVVYGDGKTLLTHAFVTQLAARNDPSKQKGFVFRLMFALELTRRDSPLWKALGTEPVEFTALERFTKDVKWKPKILYIVQESSEAKLGDIVFVAKRSTFALELKCGGPQYVWNEFVDYNKKAASTLIQDKASNIVRWFVSEEEVIRLRDPTKPARLTAKGLPDKRCQHVPSVHVQVMNGASKLPTHYTLNPELEQSTVTQFAASITRSDSEAVAIARTTGAALDPKRPRSGRKGWWVNDSRAPQHQFAVRPRGNRVNQLKEAIISFVSSLGGAAHRLAIRKRDGDVVEDPVLGGTELLVDDQEYEFEILAEST